MFDKFINNLESQGLIDMQIVDDHLNLSLETDDDIINEAESTINIFKNYISSMEVKNLDKVRLEKTISELYSEALNIQ
jgi:hypothetical protein